MSPWSPAGAHGSSNQTATTDRLRMCREARQGVQKDSRQAQKFRQLEDPEPALNSEHGDETYQPDESKRRPTPRGRSVTTIVKCEARQRA
jgi:hypothetical protein